MQSREELEKLREQERQSLLEMIRNTTCSHLEVRRKTSQEKKTKSRRVPYGLLIKTI